MYLGPHTTELKNWYVAISLCRVFGTIMKILVTTALHLATDEAQQSALKRSMLGFFSMGKRLSMTQRWYSKANFFATQPIDSLSESDLLNTALHFFGSKAALRVLSSFVVFTSLACVAVNVF